MEICFEILALLHTCRSVWIQYGSVSTDSDERVAKYYWTKLKDLENGNRIVYGTIIW